MNKRSAVSIACEKTLPAINRTEWVFVAVFSGIVLLVTTLPYLFSVITSNSERQFMGFVMNVSDHAQYLSWYKAFQSGFLIPNNLTPEPNPAIFFNLLWWTLSQIGKFTGWNYQIVYQLFRWGSGAFFFASLYGFLAFVFAEKKKRQFAFLVITLGSGLGWILVILKYALAKSEVPFPLDLYVAEGNSFLCLLAYPHFLEAAGFILVTFILLLAGERKDRLRYPAAAGLVAFLLGWQHGYDLIIIWGIPMIYGLAKWLLERKIPWYWIKGMLLLGLISCPPAIYNVLLTRLSPLWKEVLAQFSNAGVYTPSVLHYFVLMGIPLILAVGGWISELRGAAEEAKEHQQIPQMKLFIGVWFAAGWLITYIPTDFQIHMINTFQIPVGILTTIILFKLSPRLPRPLVRYQNWAAAGCILIFSITNIYLFAWRIYDLNRQEAPFYLNTDDVKALNWLEQSGKPESVVLSGENVGQYIPGISGKRAFLAHWAQTVAYFDKIALVTHFYQAGTTDAERLDLINKFSIQYILYGAQERQMGTFDPNAAPYLTRVFDQPLMQVFQVNLAKLP